MRLASGHTLAYCFNAFRISDFTTLAYAMSTFSRAVRVENPQLRDVPLAIGLWFPARALTQISVHAVRELLDQHNLYVPTMNAFPYGEFHAEPVKYNAYCPNWADPARLNYTLECARFLHALSGHGTISTLPIAYKNALTPSDYAQMEVHLRLLAEQLPEGITVAFEPEPDCMFERTDALRNFLQSHNPRGNLGICLDTCHADVVGESIDNFDGLLKIQLTAGCQVTAQNAGSIPLDPIYLHQTRGDTVAFADRPTAEDIAPLPLETMLRVHFHQGLFIPPLPNGLSPLNVTLNRVLSALQSQKNAINLQTVLEVETYAWHINKDVFTFDAIATQIAKEYSWLLQSPGIQL